MPVQLHCLQLITDKINAGNLSSGVLFATLASVNRTKKYKIQLPFQKCGQKLANSDNKGSTERHRLFIAADSIADATNLIVRIVL